MNRVANRPEDLLTPDQFAALTGLDVMEGIRDGRYPAPPIAATLDFTLTEAALGRVVFAGTPGFAVANPMGTTHGGWYGTLLDSCMACAVMTHLARGQTSTTLEYRVNIIRPIPFGLRVEAVGETRHVGRRTGVADGRITGPDGTLFATGSTTCLILVP